MFSIWGRWVWCNTIFLLWGICCSLSLAEPSRPAYPRPDKTALLQGYDRQFAIQPLPASGKVLSASSIAAALGKLRDQMGILRAGESVQGKPLFSAHGEPLKAHNLLMPMDRVAAMIISGSPAQREELSEVLRDAAAFLDQEIRRWQAENPGKPVEARLTAYNFPAYSRIQSASRAWPPDDRTRLALSLLAIIPFEMDAPRPNVNMDWLKARTSYVARFPAGIEDAEKRFQMVSAVADYYDRVLESGLSITPEGATRHHGTWHYAYGSYSVFPFLDSVVKLHQAGWYLSATSYDRIRELARAGAFLTAGSGGRVPFNLQGRVGCVDNLAGAVPSWLHSAAMLGDGRRPDRPDPELAGLLLSLYPEHPLAVELAKQGFQASRASLDGHRTMNIGAVAAHRRGEWLACAGGLSPLTSKHEIYSWLQANNYSLFVKRGGLLLLHPSYSADDKELGFGLSAGFHWAHIPGATTCLCSDTELMTRAGNTFVTNSGVAGGTSLEGDGIWGLAQARGPGALFHKSMFFFDNRITVVTSGIRRWSRRLREDAVGGFGNVPTDRPIITTLFQWPLDETRPTVVSGKEVAGLAETSSQNVLPRTWLVDRHGHGHYIHPSKEASLHVVRRRQEFCLLYDKNLKDPKDNPIRWGEKTWAVAGVPVAKADLESVRDKYRPGAGAFELAWLTHKRFDDSRAEPSVYTVLPMAGVEKTREFATTAAGEPPYRLLCASDSLHSLYDVPSKTFCYVVFDPDGAAWPSRGPLKGASAPCFVMIRETDSGLAVSVAEIDKDLDTIRLQLAGRRKLLNDPRGVRTLPVGARTALDISTPDHTPRVFHVE